LPHPWDKRFRDMAAEPDGELTALRAANLAFSGRRQKGVTTLASIELKVTDPRSSVWEVAAMASVGLLTALVLVGFWLL
jgi:hypothetical protein